MIALDIGAKFSLGQIVITPNAAQQVPQEDILAALRRHVRGDWGELDPHDQKENDVSLMEGFRILSAYRTGNGIKFWIITEADRLATTILLPEDY